MGSHGTGLDGVDGKAYMGCAGGVWDGDDGSWCLNEERLELPPRGRGEVRRQVDILPPGKRVVSLLGDALCRGARAPRLGVCMEGMPTHARAGRWEGLVMLPVSIK